MEIIFLGTSGMHPTKERNLFSVLFRYKSENILIDCGEGTQRQLRMINIPSTKTNKILLTHLHGDHINGLPGLLQNLQANQYSKDLEIYGPVGLKKLMYHIFEIAGLRMRVKINEIKSGIIYKSKDFYFTRARIFMLKPRSYSIHPRFMAIALLSMTKEKLT